MAGLSTNPELRYWREHNLGGVLLAQARYGPHDFQRHVHDELVIAVTEGGAGKVVTRRGADVGDAGTVWVFAPGESHGGRVEGQRWIYRGFYLDTEALEALGQALDGEGAVTPFVAPGLYRDPQLAGVLASAHECLDSPTALIERQQAWWLAMGLLVGRYGRPRPVDGSRGTETTAIARALALLHDRYREEISVADLARVARLSRYHFIRAFNRGVGMTPHAYLGQVRLLAAKKLLAGGVAPAAAAAEVGFYDQSHLSRAFRHAYGMTPGRYVSLMRPRPG